MERIEFFTGPDGVVRYVADGGEAKRLTRFSEPVAMIARLVEERFPGAWARLSQLYPARKSEGAAKDKAVAARVERFVRCNMGEHDLLTADFDNGRLNFEEVRCPLRGICPDEGVVCKPTDALPLTPAERKVASMYAYGYTFNEIAAELGKSPQTIKVQLHGMKKKLGVENCRALIKVLRSRSL